MKYKNEYSMLFPAKLSSSNVLKLYTLYLLNYNKRMYGKEILDTIATITNKIVWKPSHGTLYPLLQDMIKQGHIKEESTEGCRRYYSITESGREEYRKNKEAFKDMILYSSQFYENLLSSLYNHENNI